MPTQPDQPEHDLSDYACYADSIEYWELVKLAYQLIDDGVDLKIFEFLYKEIYESYPNWIHDPESLQWRVDEIDEVCRILTAINKLLCMVRKNLRPAWVHTQYDHGLTFQGLKGIAERFTQVQLLYKILTGDEKPDGPIGTFAAHILVTPVPGKMEVSVDFKTKDRAMRTFRDFPRSNTPTVTGKMQLSNSDGTYMAAPLFYGAYSYVFLSSGHGFYIVKKREGLQPQKAA